MGGRAAARRPLPGHRAPGAHAHRRHRWRALGAAEGRAGGVRYAEPGADDTAGTAVATARLGEDALADVRVVYRQKPKLEGGYHFGSRIAFDGKGHVFISQSSWHMTESWF